MANILDRIIDNKRRETEAEMKSGPSVAELAAAAALAAPATSMAKALRESSTGIIAEFKRRSPSKGEIYPMAMVNEIVPAYEAAGATACSVLTDTPFFGGSLSDLSVASSIVNLPLLRKDFIISDYQILQARLAGASAILLIAAALPASEIERLISVAHSIGLEVLLEIHNIGEIEKIDQRADMIGVNNRDLTTFTTDRQLSFKIAGELPDGPVRVAESGLTDFNEVMRLRRAGYRGFLIGERFMSHRDPGMALREFINGKI